MIPMWVTTVLCVYILIDGLVAMYFKYKYQGPYSDGIFRTYTPTLMFTIPTILICKIFGWDHITKEPEGVHKISWKYYKKVVKKK